MSYSPSNVLDFLIAIHNLKTTKRSGWVRRKVQSPESISDHMYMMSMMAWLAAPASENGSHLNKEKCIKIALVHDVAECIVGDITPDDPISKDEKARLEGEAMETLRNSLGGGAIADEMVALWQEYENGSTPEATLVKQIDKFEMVLQAYLYEKSQSIDLTEFYGGVRSKLTDPVLQAWFFELAERRLAHLPSLPPITGDKS